MTKINEIKQLMFKLVVQKLDFINKNINTYNIDKYPRNLTKEITEIIYDTNYYISSIKKNYYKMPTEIQFFQLKQAKDLQSINKIFPIKDLFVEAHFILKGIEENSIHPKLHNSYKKHPSIRVWKESHCSYIIEDVPEIIAKDFENVAKKKFNGEISLLSNYFSSIELPENKELNEMYNKKVAGKLNPLASKKVLNINFF